MKSPSIFYEQIDDVMQGFHHEILLMRADLDSFVKKYEGKEISDALNYQLNNRRKRVEKMDISYRFIANYIDSIMYELRETKAEKYELLNKIKYESDSIEEIRAKQKAWEKPPLPLKVCLAKWVEQLQKQN